MKRKLVSGIMLTLLLTGALTLVFDIQSVKASGTIYIRADGSVEPEGTPISSIDNVTYTFTDNIYDEVVVERDNIVVDGAGCTLQGTGGGDGIHLSYRSNVTIKNMEIKRFECGIYLYGSSDNSISGNNITENRYDGIYLYGSSDNSISGNNITNNYLGIWLEHSSNYNIISGNNIANERNGIYLFEFSGYNTVSGNNITNNTEGIKLVDSPNNNMSQNVITNNMFGIWLIHSPNNTLRNNDASNNKFNFYVTGSSLSDFIQDIDESNTANDKPVYWWINRQNMDVPHDVGWIALINCTRITVKNLDLTNNGQGALLAFTSKSTITQNNIRNNIEGIALNYSSNNTITGNNIEHARECGISFTESSKNSVSGNNITNNRYGIALGRASSHNTICRNDLTENNLAGIRLSYSSCNIVSGNHVINSEIGIHFFESSNNVISGNNITNNRSGILFSWCAHAHNIVCRNDIINNDKGIRLGRASDNIIYHNNIVSNTQQVYIHYPLGYANFWDDGYPSGGNFWSDHVTVDDCCGENQDEPGSDGIVDEPYVIDDDNRDNYPLVKPWSPVVSATMDIDPETLNLKSKGKWITAYIQLPEGYSAEDIDAATVLLNETIPSVLDPKYDFVTNSSEYIIDHDSDGILERMVKFSRDEVAEFITGVLGVEYGSVSLTITGELYDGSPFEGTCPIKVLFPGDADDDGDVDFDDFTILAGCYGMIIGNPSFNPLADFDEDGHIKYDDFLILAGNYGKTAV